MSHPCLRCPLVESKSCPTPPLPNGQAAMGMAVWNETCVVAAGGEGRLNGELAANY